MQLHPLLNPESKHYQTRGKVAIEEMEKETTAREMIGACKSNIFKYEFRKHDKGTLEADEKKRDTWEAYMTVLKDMSSLSLDNFLVCDALKMTKRFYAYRPEDLKDETKLF